MARRAAVGSQHDIAFGDARLFQTFGDSQIGVVGL
jgi:hypothetical protein